MIDVGKGIKAVIGDPIGKGTMEVQSCLLVTVCLPVLQLAHVDFLGTWSSEIFETISGLIRATRMC